MEKLQGIEALAAAVSDRRLPPVDEWNPPYCGDSEIRIAADGSWFHQGSPIHRPALVRLFSSILRREADGSHVLVTPAEKLSVEVDDAPFVATTAETSGTGRARRIALRLNTGDALFAGPEHRLRVEQGADGPRPYVEVRRGLDALIARPAYYDLAQWALEEGGNPPGLWSDGCFFAMGDEA